MRKTVSKTRRSVAKRSAKRRAVSAPVQAAAPAPTPPAVVRFHQYCVKGNRRRGVIAAIYDRKDNMFAIGWSLCNRAKGDVFDPEVGRELAYSRLEKAVNRRNRLYTPGTSKSSPDYAVLFERVVNLDPDVVDPDAIPDGLRATLRVVVDRIERIAEKNVADKIQEVGRKYRRK